MKIAAKLTVLLFGVVAIIAATTVGFVCSASLKTLEKEMTDSLKNHVLHVMDTLDRYLYERYADIQMLADDPIVSSRSSTPRQITQRLIEYRNTYKTYVSLSFFGLDRIRIADTAGLRLGKRCEMTGYWEDVLRGEISAASDIRFAEELQMPVIYFASPVKDKHGKTFGVVVARVPIARLYELTKTEAGTHGIGEDTLEIDLVDKTGLLLYSNYNKRGVLRDNLADLPWIKMSLAGEQTGSVIHRDPIHEVDDFYVFVRERGHLDFEGNGWTLSAHLPASVVFAPAVELRNKIIAIAIPIAVFAIIISLISARVFTRSIDKLRNAAVEIGKGNLDTKIDIKSKDEIGDLALSFTRMAGELSVSMAKEKRLAAAEKNKAEEVKAANQQLRASEQQLKAANQQLRASEQQLKTANQQLRASEQQLKAANQQLRASEQQLRAANQQLKAKEQALRKSQEELRGKMGELERFNRLMVGREMEMVRLKEEVNSLLEKSGGSPKYEAPKKIKDASGGVRDPSTSLRTGSERGSG